MIDNIVYTIGVPLKPGGLKPGGLKPIDIRYKRNREKSSQMKNDLQQSNRKSSPFSKLFFPQHIIDNNKNPMSPLPELSLAALNSIHDFKYQLNTNHQFNRSESPNFLNMNLRSAPFNLTADEISKLSSEHQSENIRLIPAAAITNNLQNAYLLPIQQNVRTTNQSSINVHSTKVQLPNTSKSNKLNKTHDPLKSKITTAKQQNFSNSSLTMHTSIQHMQIKTTTNQEHPVQQFLETTNASIHKQQTSNLMQVTRSGMSSQSLPNSIIQQEPQVQLLGSNNNVAGTNVQQQQLSQQLRTNKNLTKGNLQQRLSPQTKNRSSNINTTQRPSPRQNLNKSSSLDDTGTGKHTRMQ